MKKIFYSFAILAAVGLSISACTKEKTGIHGNAASTTMDENQKVIESLNKSGVSVNTNQYRTDAFLIAAINGQNKEFAGEYDLFELLLDEVALSDQILTHVINSKRISDADVELLLVLSAPVAENVIRHVAVRRPAMPLDKIMQAQLIINRNQYAISGTTPYTVFFGDELTYNGSELYGNQVSEIKLSIYPDHDIIIRRRPCNDDNKKWMCGTAKRVELISSDGTTGHYTLDCEQSHDYCFKIPKGSRIK